jgi:putative heme-binding domain-containing protein
LILREDFMLFTGWRVKCVAALAVVWTCLLGGTSLMLAQQLDAELKAIPAVELAKLAKQQGDAARGAIVFFQQSMACNKCHSVSGAKPNDLGPNLAELGKDVADEYLVDAVLFPSKVIRKGFDSVSVIDGDGKTVTGILYERTPEKIVVRDLLRDGALTTIATGDIEDFRVNTTSIMPEGQVNQLNSRQQFLDLIRYLMEIRDGGESRALQLQPAAALLAVVVPEYEKHLDHSGFISSWDKDAFKRGEAIYQRVCANCHGTKDQPGSLPTSLRFAEGKFKNGPDPLSMYRTLTHGFGFMTPQTWMVPSQKYDVVHYIREAYLKPHNPSQYSTVDDAYLAKLPKGNTRGPAPSEIFAWSAMDYGPSLTHTYQVPGQRHNFAYKGVAVRLDEGAGGVSRGRHWMIFDTDTLRAAAAWNGSGKPTENFIDWRGIQFDGQHGVHPQLVGQIAFANSTGPGWANPQTGEFTDDQRVQGRDGKNYGPLPRDWGKYKGLYHHGLQVVFSYTIGSTDVLESPQLVTRQTEWPSSLLVRTFNIGPREKELLLQVAESPSATGQHSLIVGDDKSFVILAQTDPAANPAASLIAGVAPAKTPLEWKLQNGRLLLKLPAGNKTLRFRVWLPATPPADFAADPTLAEMKQVLSALNDVTLPSAELDLAPLTHGGPPRWPQQLETQIATGSNDGPFVADVLTAPESNPWLAQTRFTGLDFLPDGRIAVCSWDGDVWLVELDSPTLRWRRIASGMFQPLGLKVVDGKIHVMCRDQLTVLHDLNGDEEIDFYECLNNDHQVTEHFHEFAMGLQTDAAGNFYYAKSARHALPAVVPHHGTLLRISKDGTRTDILANGFRAANGVCLNPDGSFVVTDQEGHWNPKNRINWVTLNPNGKPNFYGNMFGYHDVTDTADEAMVPPLCWITNAFDRSPAELLWVNSDRWGPLNGSLLNLSYGYGKVYVVPHENVRGTMQGGLIELPLPAFPTGVMRGRFDPTDGQLYLCGMFAWAGNAQHPGGLYRIRATGRPMHLPIGFHATKTGLELTFTEPLDPNSLDTKNIQLKVWSLKRTANYGSKRFDEKNLSVRAATLVNEGKTLVLEIPDFDRTWCMELRYELRGADGQPVFGSLHGTVNELSYK